MHASLCKPYFSTNIMTACRLNNNLFYRNSQDSKFCISSQNSAVNFRIRKEILRLKKHFFRDLDPLLLV